MRKRIFNIKAMFVCLILILFVGCTLRINRRAERPPGLGYHAMAYDSESRRVILYGGQTGNIAEHPEIFTSSETWAFDLARNCWQKMAPESSPPAMSAHAMAYDSESDRVILHGGGGIFDGIFEMERLENYVLNQTWAYDFNNDTWMKMSDGPPRLGHRIAYDAESDRIVMFSGACFRDGRFQDVQETWVYDFNSDTWTEMKPSLSPAARHYYGLAYDTESDRVILWGGFIGKDVLDHNIWTYDLNRNTWLERPNTRLELIPESGPDPRWYQAMAYDQASDRIIVYGGADEGSDEMLAYGFSDTTWTKIQPTTNPGKISRMPMVYVPDAGKLVLFGGQLDSRQFTYSDATWLYDLNTDAWTDVTVRQGEYLGQREPGYIPEVFEPQVITPERTVHSSVVISANGNEIYWSSFYEDTARGVIMTSKREKEGWTTPKPVSFSDRYDARNPFLSSDEKKLYFFGRRTATENQSARYRIWITEKKNGVWSEPMVLDSIINSGNWAAGPSVTRNMSLYFTSYRDDSQGMFDIYRARCENSKYLSVERLGNEINSDTWDLYPYVAPDESFLIFSSKREGSYGGQDLYISFRNAGGTWSPAQNMGPAINSKGDELFPFVTEDRRFMFFGKTDPNAEKSNWVDVYWVDARIIEKLKRH